MESLNSVFHILHFTSLIAHVYINILEHLIFIIIVERNTHTKKKSCRSVNTIHGFLKANDVKLRLLARSQKPDIGRMNKLWLLTIPLSILS